MLAVIIPYFKINFFADCLASLANQSSLNFTVYIGNDNSPDDPISVINQYSDQINVTYKKFDENLGSKSLVGQWNRCLEMVKDEEWLMILGDDDILSPGCVEDFYFNLNEIKSLEIKVARYSTIKINEKGDFTSQLFTHPKIENSIQFLFKKLQGISRSSLSEYIFNKEELQKKGFKEFPLAWHADDLAFLEFSNFGELYALNNSCVYFRNSGVNISSLVSNIKQKNKASFLFYYYLLSKCPLHLEKEEEFILYSKLEKSFLNDKTEIEFYFKYWKLRTKNSDYVGSFNFIIKYFGSIIKSKRLWNLHKYKKNNT